MFPNVPVYMLQTALSRHSGNNSAAINNRYLDFVQTCDLTSLSNDNHVDNYRREMLMSVYYDSIVNNRPKMRRNQHTCTKICNVNDKYASYGNV